MITRFETVLARYRAEWGRERDARDEAVAYAKANKVDPGKDYWQPERRARLKLNMAQEVVAAFREIGHD